MPPENRVSLQESAVIRERTPDEKRAYVQGYEAGIKAAVALAHVYEGQHDLPGRVERAGLTTANLLRESLA